MNEAVVNVTEAMDRYIFSAGFVVTVVFCGLRIFGIITWPWLWITAPVWIWVILTVLRSLFIVRPWVKSAPDRDAG